MNVEEGKQSSLLHGISTNNKGKLVWTKSYSELQMFVEEVLNLSDGEWGNPGGDAKQFKSEALDMRWYPESQSITLNGKLKNELRMKLVSLAGISEQLANEINDGGEASGGSINNLEGNDGCGASVLNASMNSKENSANNDENAILKNTVEVIKAEIEALKSQFTCYQDVTNLAILDPKASSTKLTNDVNTIELKKLSQENQNLKDEINALSERVNNLAFILSDLNNKVKIDRGSSCINENEVSSRNSVSSVDLEGMKLEMVILETRLFNAIKENKSDTCSLKFKVKDLEGVIRQQDDAIHKLSEDNLILKSKLSSFENLIYKVISHDHVNNDRANESASATQGNDRCGFHDKDQLINLNSNNSRFIETSTRENPLLLNSTQVPDPREKQRLTIDLATQRKEEINLMTNVANDQCGSQDKDQPTNLNINNSSFIEISTNENRSLLNSTQAPNPCENQRVTIDLITKPKEGINIIYNSQPNNENNLGNNRHLDAKHNTPCPFLKRRGWCAKGSRCDFKHPHEQQKHLVPCPFLQKRRHCLKGTRCDFSHSATFPHSIQPTRPVKGHPTSSLFYDNQQPMVPQQRTHGTGYNRSVQWYPNGPGFFNLPRNR